MILGVISSIRIWDFYVPDYLVRNFFVSPVCHAWPVGRSLSSLAQVYPSGGPIKVTNKRLGWKRMRITTLVYLCKKLYSTDIRVKIKCTAKQISTPLHSSCFGFLQFDDL
jgi:hypothetical protein